MRSPMCQIIHLGHILGWIISRYLARYISTSSRLGIHIDIQSCLPRTYTPFLTTCVVWCIVCNIEVWTWAMACWYTSWPSHAISSLLILLSPGFLQTPAISFKPKVGGSRHDMEAHLMLKIVEEPHLIWSSHQSSLHLIGREIRICYTRSRFDSKLSPHHYPTHG